MTKIHLSGLVDVYKPWITSLVCKPVLLPNSYVFHCSGLKLGKTTSIFVLVFQTDWRLQVCRTCASYLQPSPMSDWLCMQGFRPWVALEWSHVLVVWGFCCTKFDSFFLIFGRSISKGALSTTRGLKLYPAVLQRQRNFKAFADLSGT